ncbi:MAG: ATP-dependent RNA helicase HrpA, partial [Phycisphaerales bacterium]|nr:ATP-dependent RNA helicase HrpA [Phycisphaerales bacterium]
MPVPGPPAQPSPEHPSGSTARPSLARPAPNLTPRERARATLSISYPPDLPISQRKDDIAAAITKHQVIIVAGETGSGKTTQLPKICLEALPHLAGMIGHTQPRRLAARTVAGRIAQELNAPLGEAVGYKVRFGDKTSQSTLIKVMTDGILLAETQGGGDGGRELRQYGVIIIDEAHERSLNIDFLLGYLRRLTTRRPDLKVIITSATIDPEGFSRHFNNAPIIEVSGRAYPVEVRYRPLSIEPEPGLERDPVGQGGEREFDELTEEEGILAAVDELARSGPPGDVLVFLPGEREIRETAEALRKHHPPSTEILPLYARLSASEQLQVFQPSRGYSRRIVLATNVAETSLTVPGIRSVIDTGLARMSRYSGRTRVQRLPIEPIARSSADQRAGRCGRLGPGVCIRLYSQEDYEARDRFTEPEILRTNLASVVLQMKSLRLGEVSEFPFLDPPDSRLVRDGYETLLELGAVDEAGELTPLGEKLARLPVDPRLGRMILAADHERCLHEVVVIAAALSIQDPRERPSDERELADIAHAQWRDEGSDFISLLRLWKWHDELREKLSHNQLRRACKQSYLSYMRMREWNEVYHQLHGLVADMGFRFENRPPPPPPPTPQQAAHAAGTTQGQESHAKGRRRRRGGAPRHATPDPSLGSPSPSGTPRIADYDSLHRALLSGLLSSVGMKKEGAVGEYAGPRGVRFSIHPGSGLAKKFAPPPTAPTPDAKGTPSPPKAAT